MRPMRRYVYPFDSCSVSGIQFDVVIAGTGIAGLAAALTFPAHWKVLVVAKEEILTTNSYLAQGGIAALCNPADQLESFLQDTLAAGHYENNPEAVRTMIADSPDAIASLISWGASFDRQNSLDYDLTREGGHSCRRILHAKDETGKMIMEALIHSVRSKKNIMILEKTAVADVVTGLEGTTQGVLLLKPGGRMQLIKTPHLVLATGGVGHLFSRTTNAKGITGDGIALAARAGATLEKLHYIQFHPTGLYQKEKQQTFLISESLRGEGGILRNHDGDAFMKHYHPEGDLAPRDIVANGIWKEMKKHGLTHVFLDITHKDPEWIQNRFPKIYRECLKAGITITREWIPVVPVQHYIMGGIQSDLSGRTSVPGLYAIGECACTGVHGANRLASNSLLEGLVFAIRCAESIIRNTPMMMDSEIRNEKREDETDSQCFLLKENQAALSQSFEFIQKRIQHSNDHHFQPGCEKEDMVAGLLELKGILRELEETPVQYNFQYLTTINMAMVSVLLTEMLLAEKNRTGKREGQYA